MTDAELIAMARLAQRDDRMSTGALYGDLADRIEELDRACSEWADVSQANYQRAKKAEAKLAKAMEAERKLHEAHIKAQAAEIEWYRDRVVWGFYENETPKFYQGKEGEHEICEPVSAKEVTCYFNEIERLRSYLERIEKASEFFTNPEHSELTLRYANEGTQRLAREALTGGKP